MKKYKLGVTYTLFSGEELLKSSILSIKDNVDYINVVWQKYSWTGTKAADNVEKILNDLLRDGLIDKIIEFKFEMPKTEKESSKVINQKQNIGVKDLKKAGCTHVMLMDVDEFYYKDEFKKAKEFVYKNHITHSACSIYDYFISPIYRKRDASDYAVPFIFKLTFLSKVFGFSTMPCVVAGCRAFPFIPLLHKFYYLNMVSLRHMTGIRKDYNKKMNASMSNFNEQGRKMVEKYSELQRNLEMMSEEEILSNGYIKLDDDFGILKEWDL